MINIDVKTVEALLKLAAQEEILPRFNQVTSQQKADGSLITEADYAMQDRLQLALLKHFPETVLLSEEMSVEQQQQVFKGQQAVWCLDPLDGTSNFAAGIPYFAVSLSLIEDGQVRLGMVYDPIRDECFTATHDTNAKLNGQDLQLLNDLAEKPLAQAMAIVDFKRLPKALATALVSQTVFASQRNFGASALDWCWLAAGRGDIYLHGKQNLWDYAAGHLILKQAGGYSATLEGEAVFVDRLETRSVIAAGSAKMMQQWQAWITANK